MPDKSEEKKRKRVIVEEVAAPSEPVERAPEQMPNEESAPLGEVKEKVEELQTITEHMSGDLEKSADVQEDIVKTVEESAPEIPAKPDSEPINQPQTTNPLWIIIPGIFLLGALLGGVIFYQKSLNKAVAPTPTPSSDVAPAPSASPQASLDLTKYPINVENGSGIAGEAGNVKNILTSAGFKVSATGNADSYSFTKTVIQAKSDVPESFITQLSDTLSKTYKLDKTQSLPDSSSDEVIVIVGSSKVQ